MNHDVIIVGSGAIAGSIAYQLASMGLQACRIASALHVAPIESAT